MAIAEDARVRGRTAKDAAQFRGRAVQPSEVPAAVGRA
jgi:hypothetical protein